MIATATNISGERIFLIHSKDCTGRRAYYFLHVPTLKLPLFKEAIGHSEINLEKYGDIITSGYGDAPQDVRAAMAKKYGWRP